MNPTRAPFPPNINRRRALFGLASGLAAAALPARAEGIERGTCSANTGRPGRYESFSFTSDGACHQVYVIGNGPPVILLHELPGLIDPDLKTGERLAANGYTVIAPLLFGDPGGEGDWLKYYRQICDPERFACNEPNKTSPEVKWLRKLVVDVRKRWTDGKGVGVVGMGLTGALPLALLSESEVVAAVLCQPTIPFNAWTRIGIKTDERALGLNDDDLKNAKARNVPLLGLRYKGDWRCRKPRFRHLVEEFGDRFYRLDVPGKHHSTLGESFSNDAFLEVTAYLNQQLHSTSNPSAGNFPRLSKPGSIEEVVPPKSADHR